MNTEGALNYDAWVAMLPPSDPQREDILNGIRHGFKITTEDYKGPYIWENNYKSATDPARRHAVEQQILEELANGRYIMASSRPRIISALGAIDKPNSNKVRLIHDCSRPPGYALNDLATPEKFSYQSVQDAVALVKENCYLAKIDLSNAYRSVKIHPTDHQVTGLAWTFEGEDTPSIMYDTRLPFGARLSPQKFNNLTQAVCRIMASKGVIRMVAYLDDFLIISPSKEECQQQMQLLIKTLRHLGFAINYSKVTGPCQQLTFLGVEFNTISCTLGLPADKLSTFLTDVKQMYSKRTASKRELQSLAGRLSWASQVVIGGRPHLRRILDLINRLSKPSHRTRVTGDMKEDLSWWICYAAQFNGTLPMIDHRQYSFVCIDACPVAAGAYFNGQCLYHPWKDWPGSEDLHINYKEVLTVVSAALLWCKQWANKIVKVHCDNQAAVAIINKGTAKDPFVMSSLRNLFWLSALFNFKLSAVYYPGSYNTIADACSRLHEPGGWDKLAVALQFCY